MTIFIAFMQIIVPFVTHFRTAKGKLIDFFHEHCRAVYAIIVIIISVGQGCCKKESYSSYVSPETTEMWLFPFMTQPNPNIGKLLSLNQFDHDSNDVLEERCSVAFLNC